MISNNTDVSTSFWLGYLCLLVLRGRKRDVRIYLYAGFPLSRLAVTRNIVGTLAGLHDKGNCRLQDKG